MVEYLNTVDSIYPLSRCIISLLDLTIAAVATNSVVQLWLATTGEFNGNAESDRLSEEHALCEEATTMGKTFAPLF